MPVYMSNTEERYKLSRCRWDVVERRYVPTAIERYRSKAEAQLAYRRALREDGAHPSLIDTETEEHIA